MRKDDDMLSHVDAAKELGISLPTLYRWLKARQIQTYTRLGDKHGYVRRGDLAKLQEWQPKRVA